MPVNSNFGGQLKNPTFGISGKNPTFGNHVISAACHSDRAAFAPPHLEVSREMRRPHCGQLHRGEADEGLADLTGPVGLGGLGHVLDHS